MFHVLPVGLEHLQSGIEFQSDQGVSIRLHADGATTFIAASLHPFRAIWHRADFTQPVVLHSHPDDQWRLPLPETSTMIRDRVARNNVLQRSDKPRWFSTLNATAEAAYRRWARENYRPGEGIRTESWHPVAVDECRAMLAEQGQEIRQELDAAALVDNLHELGFHTIVLNEETDILTSYTADELQDLVARAEQEEKDDDRS